MFVFVNYRLKFHISIVFDVSSFRIFRFRMIGNFDTVYRPETFRFRFRTVVIKQNQNQYQCFFDRFRSFSSLSLLPLLSPFTKYLCLTPDRPPRALLSHARSTPPPAPPHPTALPPASPPPVAARPGRHRDRLSRSSS
jgi:hypothetical protein